MKLLLMFAVLCLVSASGAVRAEPSNWTLDSSESQAPLKLFTKPTNDDYDAIRITTTANVKLKPLLAILINVPTLTQWMDALTSAKVIQRQDAQHFILHMTYHFPWPYHDRDSVVQDSLTGNPTTGAVTLEFHRVHRPDVPTNGRVRMTMAKGFWRLIPLGTGHTAVVYQAHLNPGGDLPAWGFNMSSASAAKITVQSLIKTAKRDSQPQLPFAIGDITQ